MARPGESVAQPSPVSEGKFTVTERCLPQIALPPLCMAAASPLLATALKSAAAKGWSHVLNGIGNHSLSSHHICQLIRNFHTVALFDLRQDPLQMPWPTPDICASVARICSGSER